MKKEVYNNNIIDEDGIAEIALAIVDKMVLEGIIQNCIDTNNEGEFIAQDIIREELTKILNK